MEGVLERFQTKFIPDPMSGCWHWLASIRSDGYGNFRVGAKTMLAHRVSWILENGQIPEGMLVCHTCDTPSCVNPDHLFLGSHKDNAADRDRKGRGWSKLNWRDVAAIRGLSARGKLQRDIARLFGVSQPQISAIIRGESWSLMEAGKR